MPRLLGFDDFGGNPIIGRLRGPGVPCSGGHHQRETGEAVRLAGSSVQQRSGTHGWADSVHLLAGKPFVEQS